MKTDNKTDTKNGTIKKEDGHKKMSQTYSIRVEHHMQCHETGKNIPTTENIIKLAQIYRVPTDYLLQVDYGGSY